MLKKIGINNVRIFSGKTWDFPISDVTAFCGTNSAGKSTILKIIPLLRQTHGIRENGEPVRGQLRFVGSQVDLGNYTTLSSDQNNEPIEISLVVSDEINKSNLEIFDYDVNVRQIVAKYNNSDISNIPIDIECSFKFVYDNNLRAELDYSDSIDKESPLGELEIRHDCLDRAKFVVHHQGVEIFKWSMSRRVEGGKNAYYVHFSEQYFSHVGGMAIMEPDDGPLPDDEPRTSISIYAALNGLLPGSMVARRVPSPPKSGKKRITKRTNAKHPSSWGVFPLPPAVEEFSKMIFSTLSNFHYIAPLRSPAKRYYIASLDTEPNIDPAGEFLPYLLKSANHIKKMVSYKPPIESDRQISEPLLLAISKWTNYLKSGDLGSFKCNSRDFQISTTKGILVELSLKSDFGNKHYSLADSGFGYSQVLPIIVTCLLAKGGGAIAIEQPELHLNPALQVRLAQFFVCMAKSNKRIIVETHSEHLVNALRVFSAENSDDLSFPEISLKFIDNSNGDLQVHDLSVSRNGTVSNWPKHFFGEALELSGRLIRAQRKNLADQR